MSPGDPLAEHEGGIEKNKLLMKNGNKRIWLLVSAVLLMMAAWVWHCSGNMKLAWREGLRLEAFPDGGICLQSEKGSIIEFQHEGLESNTGEPVVLSDGTSVKWNGITITNDYPRWLIKSAGNQISQEQENAAGQQQQYRVCADKGEIRTVSVQERRVYEISPHAVAWLRTCVLKLEQYLHLAEILKDISTFLLGCILAVILLCPIRENILSIGSLVCLPEENKGEWMARSIGDQTLRWREEKLSWWMKLLGARISYVCFRTPDGKQKVAPARMQEVRQLLWCFKNNRDEEIAKLWKRLEPTLFPVEVRLWTKVCYAWKAARMDRAPEQAVNIPCGKSTCRRLNYGMVLGGSVLLLLAAVGNFIYVGREIVKDVSAHEAIAGLLLIGEDESRLALWRKDDGRMELLTIGEGAEISWSGVGVQAQRRGFIVREKNGERVILEKNHGAEGDSVTGRRGVALDIGNDGQILRQVEGISPPPEYEEFEIPSYSMEIYRTGMEEILRYRWGNLTNIMEWLCLIILVLWSPLRTICFSIISILCLSAKNAEQYSCRKKPSPWMKFWGARMSYILIDTAGKKWICPADYPGLWVYDQHREEAEVGRFCSEDLLPFDAPVLKKITYAIIKAL